jgi:3-hydroxymyristoyl/3-hydroxydecanoyl-(acyl carrier protein) dehydratase
MSGLAREGSSLSSRFTFPPEFIGFQGHFPDKKILPGVQVQCALSLIEKRGQTVVLKEIVLANISRRYSLMIGNRGQRP